MIANEAAQVYRQPSYALNKASGSPPTPRGDTFVDGVNENNGQQDFILGSELNVSVNYLLLSRSNS